MNPDKQKRLEQAGWTVGDYGNVFSLTPEDRAAVETLLAAGRATGAVAASSPATPFTKSQTPMNAISPGAALSLDTGKESMP